MSSVVKSKEPEVDTDAELDAAVALAHEPIYLTGTEEQKQRNQAALELFDKWDADIKAMTPEELEQAGKDWEIFKKSMNDNRMSYRMRYVD